MKNGANRAITLRKALQYIVWAVLVAVILYFFMS